jgi:DNA-binding LacI/PurR family transcriptional regulator
MNPIRILSASAQVAAHLREELACGRWTGSIPGVNWFARELGVNRKTVVAALIQLEKEGVLSNEGQGRKRRILSPDGEFARPMRIGILDFDPLPLTAGYLIELQHLLAGAGHTAFLASKSLSELDMDVGRVSRFVQQNTADAWVVAAGSRDVLLWFCEHGIPAFALFGRRDGLPIAATGPNKPPVVAAAANRLMDLGHRRIVLIAHRVRRIPKPGRSERAFLDAIHARGIPVSEYNLPDWEPTVDGLHEMLGSLFRVTPPTAMIVDEAPLFAAVQQFLAARGLRVPHQVSLICTDAHPTFAWCKPAISHIRWDTGPVVRRIVRWAANISQGKVDISQSLTPAEFVEGGTIGPAPAA